MICRQCWCSAAIKPLCWLFTREIIDEQKQYISVPPSSSSKLLKSIANSTTTLTRYIPSLNNNISHLPFSVHHHLQDTHTPHAHDNQQFVKIKWTATNIYWRLSCTGNCCQRQLVLPWACEWIGLQPPVVVSTSKVRLSTRMAYFRRHYRGECHKAINGHKLAELLSVNDNTSTKVTSGEILVSFTNFSVRFNLRWPTCYRRGLCKVWAEIWPLHGRFLPVKVRWPNFANLPNKSKTPELYLVALLFLRFYISEMKI